jgi:hypothetical protein
MDQLQKKLSEVETDLRGLREDKATLGRKREEAKEKYAEVLAEGGDEQAAHAEAMEAVKAYGEVVDKIENAQAMQVDLLKLRGDSEAEVRETKPPEGQPTPFGWGSAQALADPQMQQSLAAIASSTGRFGSLELGQIATRETLLAELGGAVYADTPGTDVLPATRRAPSGDPREGAMRQGREPVYPLAQRNKVDFLNLIPVGTTDGNLVPYTQERPVTGSSFAREVAEGDIKPEGNLNDYIDADAPVRTIAAWMKTRKQALADVASLRSTIDSRLRYMVQLRLAEQVLNGNGSGVNLQGNIGTDGVGTISYSASVPLAEQVLSGITAVYLNDGAADGTVMHPLDWFSVMTAKAHNAADNAGSYSYYGGGPFGDTPMSLWGVRVIPSQVLDQGTALTADFGLGAQVLIREGVNVLFSDSDQDDFLRNRVTILAEMRAALLVWRPSLFQIVELAA